MEGLYPRPEFIQFQYANSLPNYRFLPALTAYYPLPSVTTKPHIHCTGGSRFVSFVNRICGYTTPKRCCIPFSVLQSWKHPPLELSGWSSTTFVTWQAVVPDHFPLPGGALTVKITGMKITEIAVRDPWPISPSSTPLQLSRDLLPRCSSLPPPQPLNDGRLDNFRPKHVQHPPLDTRLARNSDVSCGESGKGQLQRGWTVGKDQPNSSPPFPQYAQEDTAGREASP